MSGRRLLFISIGLNLVLAVGLLLLWWAHNARLSPGDTDNNLVTKVITRDRVIADYRKQFFTWAELESTNYDTYIANLRDINCPEETIRDIILADVNKLYDERRASEVETPNQAKALDNERRALLTRLLGADWDRSEQQTGFAFSRVAFTDPLLDELSADARGRVQDILLHWSQNAVSGKQEAAELEAQMRLELAGVLSPAQLEELMSRYSANAVNLNNQLASLQYFRATPQEFQILFRATDAIDLRLRLLGEGGDYVTQQQRNGLLQEREFAIKNALGPDRYAMYVQLQDPAFRDALGQALAAGDGTKMVRALYEINQQSDIEKAITQVDPSLTDTQRAIQMRVIELEQLKAQAQAQGHELPPLAQTEPSAAQPQPRYNQSYQISTGDTLETIAQRYQVSTVDIQAANPDVNFNAIHIGQHIYVPLPATR